MMPVNTHNRFNTMMETTAFDRDSIFRFLQTDDNMITEALDTALYGNHPNAWRSAWCLTHFLSVGNNNLQMRLGELIERVEKANPDGYQRELLKLIAKCSIGENESGQLTEICFTIWQQPKKQSSVRSEALKTLISIAENYPELKPELVLIFDSYADTLSHGIKYSLARIIKQIENEINQNKITQLC